MKTKHVRNLIAQQRERHSVLCKKRDALYIVMKKMTTTSDTAIGLLKDLQNASEEFVSFETAICSKVQHAVSVCDPDSLAVAGCLATLEVASTSVASTDVDQYSLQTVVTSMADICQGIQGKQEALCQDLLCYAHCAYVCCRCSFAGSTCD